jgi:hypothetical protein
VLPSSPPLHFSRPLTKAVAEGFCICVFCKGMVLCHRREETSLLVRSECVQKTLALTVLHVPKLLFVVRSGPRYVATYMT